MKGVNIFGLGMQTNTSSNGLQGPRGIGFRYLDNEGNFDIGDKRLANVSDPTAQKDAVNKNYSDTQRLKLREDLDKEYKSMNDAFAATLEEKTSSNREMIDSINESLIFKSQQISDMSSQLRSLEEKSISEEFLKNGFIKFKEMMDKKHKDMNDSLTTTIEENASRHGDMINTLNEIINFKSRQIEEVMNQVETLKTTSITEQFLRNILIEHANNSDIKLQSLRTELSSDTAKGIDQLKEESSDQSNMIRTNTEHVAALSAETEALKSLVATHQNQLSNAQRIMNTLQTGIRMNRDQTKVADQHLSGRLNRVEAIVNRLSRN